MAGKVRIGIRATRSVVLMLGLMYGAPPVLAANCPRPDALGTSRTLVVDAREHPLIGGMQYRETLPLNDGEVVLTFDDGPLPKYTYQILDILAAQCVKATFFLVGRQAQANPEGVRKVLAGGHTIATHSQNHPVGMQHLPLDRARAEIDDGIASVTAALGDQSGALSPFFRIPGLSRNDGIEEHARAKGLQVWSADFPADDWRPVSSRRVYDLAMQRLAAKGKGILLLHDIQPRTVAALPKILQDLKTRGYRIVHVVPATPDNPATPTNPQHWRLHPSAEPVATSRWPRVPSFAFVQHEQLPAPLLTDSYWNDIQLIDRPQVRGNGVPLPRPALWPRQVRLASIDGASILPAPAASVFEASDSSPIMMHAVDIPPAKRRIAATAGEKNPVTTRPGKRPPMAAGSRGRSVAATVPSAKPAQPAAQPGRAAAKRTGPDRKNFRRSVRQNHQVSL